ESVMANRPDCARVLCEYGNADPTIPESDPRMRQVPIQMAQQGEVAGIVDPSITKIFKAWQRLQAFLQPNVRLLIHDWQPHYNGLQVRPIRYEPKTQRILVEVLSQPGADPIAVPIHCLKQSSDESVDEEKEGAQ